MWQRFRGAGPYSATVWTADGEFAAKQIGNNPNLPNILYSEEEIRQQIQ